MSMYEGHASLGSASVPMPMAPKPTYLRARLEILILQARATLITANQTYGNLVHQDIVETQKTHNLEGAMGAVDEQITELENVLAELQTVVQTISEGI